MTRREARKILMALVDEYLTENQELGEPYPTTEETLKKDFYLYLDAEYSDISELIKKAVRRDKH